MPRGRAPRVPEKVGRVSLDFYRRKDWVPPGDPKAGTPRCRGGAGLTFLGLGVS